MKLYIRISRDPVLGTLKATRQLIAQIRRRSSDPEHVVVCQCLRHKATRRAVSLLSIAAVSWALIGPSMAAPADALAPSSGFSAEALYNQANASARAGHTADAVLNYHRAQLISPCDADISANLATTQRKAGLPVVAQNQIEGLFRRLHPNSWAWLGCAGVILVGLGAFVGRTLRIPRMARVAMTATGALAVAGLIGSAVVTWPVMHAAVVMMTDAPVRVSPVSVGEPAFKLAAGETVRVQARHGGFALVQAGAGRAGWVAQKDITSVVP